MRGALLLLTVAACTAPGEVVDVSDLWGSTPGDVSGPHCSVLADKRLFEGEWVHTWQVVDPVKEWPVRPAPPSIPIRWAIGERFLQSGDAGGDPTATWRIAGHVSAERAGGVCEWEVLGVPEDFRDGVAMRVDWSQELLAPPGLTDVEPLAPTIQAEHDLPLPPRLEQGEIRIHARYATGTDALLVEHVYVRVDGSWAE